MLPPCSFTGFTGFMAAPRPTGWVQDGERWVLWRNGREIAAVQPDAKGVRVRLSCRKLWEDKEVRAANIAQGKRYAERWCAARILEGVPLKEAVARLVSQDRPPKPSRTEMQQERRLQDALKAIPLAATNRPLASVSF